MKKLILLLLFVPLISYGQEYVIFLDGGKLLKEQEVNVCAKAFIKSFPSATEDGKIICDCFVEKLSKTYTLSKLRSIESFANNKGNFFEDIGFHMAVNSNFVELIGECMDKSSSFMNNEKLQIKSLNHKKALIKYQIETMKKIMSVDEFKVFEENIDVNGYAKCYVLNFFGKLTLKEINEMNEETKFIIQQIEENCVMFNLLKKQ